jgi:hypothetical protein
MDGRAVAPRAAALRLLQERCAGVCAPREESIAARFPKLKALRSTHPTTHSALHDAAEAGDAELLQQLLAARQEQLRAAFAEVRGGATALALWCRLARLR